MITIFTDGASRGNPGSGGFGAIISDGKMVQEIGGKEDNTTNNQMEMMAAIRAIETLSEGDEAELHTDSAYVINGITKWVFAWQKNNWQTKAKEDVMNADLWQELLDVSQNKKIKWVRISGHSGVPANERCDVIATSFADGRLIKLFHGPIEEYKINLAMTKGTEKDIKSKSNKKIAAYSYVSMVDGKVETHETWAETEKHVKGKSGARFKKSVSPEDELNIIAEFQKLG